MCPIADNLFSLLCWNKEHSRMKNMEQEGQDGDGCYPSSVTRNPNTSLGLIIDSTLSIYF